MHISKFWNTESQMIGCISTSSIDLLFWLPKSIASFHPHYSDQECSYDHLILTNTTTNSQSCQKTKTSHQTTYGKDKLKPTKDTEAT